MTLTNPCGGNLGSRIVHILLATCLAVAPAVSENLNPVHWTLEAPQSAAAPGSTAVLKLRAAIEPGYHPVLPDHARRGAHSYHNRPTGKCRNCE
jgi:hypothetical protein